MSKRETHKLIIPKNKVFCIDGVLFKNGSMDTIIYGEKIKSNPIEIKKTKRVELIAIGDTTT